MIKDIKIGQLDYTIKAVCKIADISPLKQAINWRVTADHADIARANLCVASSDIPATLPPGNRLL